MPAIHAITQCPPRPKIRVSDIELHVVIAREGDIARAIVQARKMSKEVAFGAVDQSKIATAVSELARNILKYAGRGEIVLRLLERETARGIEVVARDQGCGIEDKAKALADHFSSGGTLGLGLPGVKRMMDEFDLHSEPGAGTQVTVTKWL